MRTLTLVAQATLMGLGCAQAAYAQSTDSSDSKTAAVTLPAVEVTGERDSDNHIPGQTVRLTPADLEQANAQSLGDIVRYQPLVSAPGTTSGASRKSSSFDRGGTTGYNIRGIEGNRIGLDIDGVELPQATSRPYLSRAGTSSFGIGRDFIDPEMYSEVEITSGTTTARRAAGGIGGAVGFRTKSPDNYLSPSKSHYFGAKLGHDSADRSWNESVTAAGQSGIYSGLLAYSRRDGHETRNHSGVVDAAPEQWHSNALLLKGQAKVDSQNTVTLSADLYRRKNNNVFDGWNSNGTALSDHSHQRGDAERNTVQLAHQWTPGLSWLDSLDTRLSLQNTKTSDRTDSTSLSSEDSYANYSGSRSKSIGLSSTGDKRLGRHHLSAGFNVSQEKTQRPWEVYDVSRSTDLMRPQPNSQSTRLGVFAEDEIAFDLAGHRFALIPGLRVDRVSIKPTDLGSIAGGALTEAEAAQLYGGSNTSTIVSPSLAVVYDIKPDLSVYAQYKRGGRAPSVGDLYGSWNMDANYLPPSAQYALIGNRDLKKETSNGFDLGIKGTPTPGVVLNASVFYTRYKDFIAYTRYSRRSNPEMFSTVPAHIGTIYQAANRDEAHIYGAEFSARLNHGQWMPALSGFYTTYALGYSKGKAKSNYPGDQDTDLDTVLPAKAVLGVGYDAPYKAWGISLTGTFVKARQATATNRDGYTNSGADLTESSTETFRVPGHAVFDVFGYWQLTKHARLTAGLYNLANKRYWDYSSARDIQPQTAQGQRSIELLTNPGRSAAVSLAVAF